MVWIAPNMIICGSAWNHIQDYCTFQLGLYNNASLMNHCLHLMVIYLRPLLFSFIPHIYKPPSLQVVHWCMDGAAPLCAHDKPARLD